MRRLRRAHVAVYGLGGVGGYVVEALARAGVGRLYLVDSDVVDPTNLNRQVLATVDAVGRPKAEVAAERVLGINPEATVEAVSVELTPETVESHVPRDLSHAVDAIDSVGAKAALILALRARGVPLVCCLGAGGRVDPTSIRVADIEETAGCGLARKLRKRLHRAGVRTGIRCVYSIEPPRLADEPGSEGKPGTIAYLPGLLGLTAAGLVLREILEAGG
jgi:tRNA A37 threonylcarbamoyladenosine dehydratase